MKLTDANLAVIEADFAASGKADKVYFDEDLPGFGLRLRAGSKKKRFGCAAMTMMAFSANLKLAMRPG